MPQKDTKKTFETIENMTVIKKNLQETHNAEEEEENDRQKIDSKAQFIELEATFDIPRVNETFLSSFWKRNIYF